MSNIKAPKILDNKTDFVYKELQDSIKKDSKLSIISALFSMYAYDGLKKDLDKIDSMRFIYTKLMFFPITQFFCLNFLKIKQFYSVHLNMGLKILNL